jgi:hypothetical protein
MRSERVLKLFGLWVLFVVLLGAAMLCGAVQLIKYLW